jgi:integrase
MIAKYLQEHSPKKAPKSHVRDRSLANHLLQHFGGYTLHEISPHLIYQYKVKRLQEGAAPKTLNNELFLMGHAFNLASKEWEWIRENPVKKVSKEKVNNVIDRWLTFQEEERLLAASPEWLREIILFALNTGMRQGEILDLQWPMVDLSRKTVTILEQKNKGKDTLPLNASALEVLKRRGRVRSIKSNLVFYNGNQNRINARNLQRAFDSVLKKAGIEKFRFHDLRHTWATRLIQAGVDSYTVQRLGRWKSSTMVMRYAHHCAESLRRGAETLDRLCKKSSTNLAQSNKKRLTPVELTP